MSDAFFTRNRAWLRNRVDSLRADRNIARIAGDAGMVSAIDANLKYYRAAMSNNDGGLFPIDTMERV